MAQRTVERVSWTAWTRSLQLAVGLACRHTLLAWADRVAGLLDTPSFGIRSSRSRDVVGRGLLTVGNHHARLVGGDHQLHAISNLKFLQEAGYMALDGRRS